MSTPISQYGFYNKVILHHSVEFQLGKVQIKLDVYKRDSGSPPYDFCIYRKEETPKYEEVWRFINGSDWDTNDMGSLLNHVVAIYQDELFNGEPSGPPKITPGSIAPAGLVPKREYKPGDIPPAGLPNG